MSLKHTHSLFLSHVPFFPVFCSTNSNHLSNLSLKLSETSILYLNSLSLSCHWKLPKEEAGAIVELILFIFLLSGIIILPCLLSCLVFLLLERERVNPIPVTPSCAAVEIFFFFNYKSNITKNWKNKENLSTTVIS